MVSSVAEIAPYSRASRAWIGSGVPVAGRDLLPFAVEVAARQWPGVRQCALMAAGGSACLVIEGAAGHRADWQARAARLGINRVAMVARMPMDPRHASKIDRGALGRHLRGRRGDDG